MNAIIAHQDEIARKVFTAYFKKLSIKSCNEARDHMETITIIQKNEIDLLVIPINWLFNDTILISWLGYNKVYKKTKIIAVTTDFSLDHEEWCEEHGIYYIMLPLTFSIFKVLVVSNDQR
ncbi:hypothetical protein ACVNS2_08110 [Paenibacillus caseinilyticus]|uniref:Response regulatory domain-containing protein n=1 Tax=Paenibacillus mucilaginosus K02 TaxID=997761 RepID=I0BE29_9BACL|nr:hypothetical protein [Paenibacillus mucilaginosus]AFH60626.1 hypothetical protein B2K_07810 [Paenibacillus mucilaginosus K02]